MKTSIRTMRAAGAAALVAGLLGCAQFAGIATLRGADAAAADVAPEAKAYAGKRPGSGQAIARTFKEQPPLIPHAVDNFDEITVAENQCMECHSPERHANRTQGGRHAPAHRDRRRGFGANGPVPVQQLPCRASRRGAAGSQHLRRDAGAGDPAIGGSV